MEEIKTLFLLANYDFHFLHKLVSLNLAPKKKVSLNLAVCILMEKIVDNFINFDEKERREEDNII